MHELATFDSLLGNPFIWHFFLESESGVERFIKEVMQDTWLKICASPSL